jgi:hypothetical protein
MDLESQIPAPVDSTMMTVGYIWCWLILLVIGMWTSLVLHVPNATLGIFCCFTGLVCWVVWLDPYGKIVRRLWFALRDPVTRTHLRQCHINYKETGISTQVILYGACVCVTITFGVVFTFSYILK